MPVYNAPIADMRFILNEVLDVAKISSLPGYEECSPELIESILEECGKLCTNEFFPINQSGDQEGCHFENGVVRTPKGFKEAYKTYLEAGLSSVACEKEYGGQGMPKLLEFAITEMLCSSNLSFSMYPMLSHGAYTALKMHGTEVLQKQYMPKLCEGVWTGTMCLTEPHCGTDLRLLRTKAVPQADGSYKITGTKIFISAGEHDLAENIVHLVIARTPDAPDGIKGISLFLVPKFMPKADGTLGPRNGAACGSIEHKMGIRASSTCVMNFDEATGYLVGHLHEGMKCMFTMMNAARLGVGMQGLGLAEVSYQNAVLYAKERLQGRALNGAKAPEKAADPIIVHPDIRYMLMTMKSVIEGMRALCYSVSIGLDYSEVHEDAKIREENDDYVSLMTPIVKAFCTDYGFEIANLGVQIYGGHGYIAEHGMEQYVRDARIAQIYEGTNGIQALDLVGRKLAMHGGRMMRQFFPKIDAFIKEHKDNAEIVEFTQSLAEGFTKLQQATAHIMQKGMADKEEAGAAATDYLRLFGYVAVCFMWCKMVKVCFAKKDEEFYKTKIATGRFYIYKIMPKCEALFKCITSGKATLMALEEAAF